MENDAIQRVQPYDDSTTNEETSKREDQHIDLEPREDKHEKYQNKASHEQEEKILTSKDASIIPIPRPKCLPPFLQRLMKKKEDEKFKKFISMLSNYQLIFH